RAFSGSNARLIMLDPVGVGERMYTDFPATYPGSRFGEMPIHYFDPREPTDAHESPHPIQSKSFEYAFEMEWRYMVLPKVPHAADHMELFLGHLHDVASLFSRPCAARPNN